MLVRRRCAQATDGAPGGQAPAFASQDGAGRIAIFPKRIQIVLAASQAPNASPVTRTCTKRVVARHAVWSHAPSMAGVSGKLALASASQDGAGRIAIFPKRIQIVLAASQAPNASPVTRTCTKRVVARHAVWSHAPSMAGVSGKLALASAFQDGAGRIAVPFRQKLAKATRGNCKRFGALVAACCRPRLIFGVWMLMKMDALRKRKQEVSRDWAKCL